MTLSLHARGAPLAAPGTQIAAVDGVDLSRSAHGGDFARALAATGRDALRPGPVEIFQINLGKLCNMTCRHCHVDAGPDRTDEMMDRATAEACLASEQMRRVYFGAALEPTTSGEDEDTGERVTSGA